MKYPTENYKTWIAAKVREAVAQGDMPEGVSAYRMELIAEHMEHSVLDPAIYHRITGYVGGPA